MNKMKLSVAFLVTALLVGCGRQKEGIQDNVIRVKTMNVMASPVAGQQSYSGTIEEMSGTSLSFSGAGTIKSLFVGEGQNVRAGQLIGIMDATSNGNAVMMAHAATAQAQDALKQAEDAYRRMKLLHDNGSLTDLKWVEVETKVSQARQLLRQTQAAEKIARKGLSDTRLTAPFSGYVSKKMADVGQNVMPGQGVFDLVKIDQVKVKISVPENEIAKIRMGQKMYFKVSSIGEQLYVGTVVEKAVSADVVSRSYEVKALVGNPSHQLLPGMVCDVYTNTDNRAACISLPAHIIQIDIDNEPFVWTVVGGKARKVKVSLGENVGENVIVKSGLQSGDRVIVEGQQKVSTNMKVCE